MDRPQFRTRPSKASVRPHHSQIGCATSKQSAGQRRARTSRRGAGAVPIPRLGRTPEASGGDSGQLTFAVPFRGRRQKVSRHHLAVLRSAPHLHLVRAARCFPCIGEAKQSTAHQGCHHRRVCFLPYREWTGRRRARLSRQTAAASTENVSGRQRLARHAARSLLG